MSKKRVAYFYDEDVGNFHYGECLDFLGPVAHAFITILMIDVCFLNDLVF